MTFRWNTEFLLAVLFIGASAQATAQCRPADADGQGFVLMVQRYANGASASWAAARDSLRISPPASGTGVVQITKSATCKLANAAYQKVATGNRATLSGQVYVVQSGTTYIVWDPAYKYAAESGAAYMVFDSNWVFLRGFM